MSYSVESHVRQVAEGTVGEQLHSRVDNAAASVCPMSPAVRESHDALHSPHIVPRPAAAGLAVGSQV